MPPKAARAVGPPKIAAAPMGQSREAHRSARPHHSPKGGQSPAVFAGDWPPSGAPACGNADAEGEAGYATRCGGIDKGVDEGIDMGVDVPLMALESSRVRSSSQ